MSSFFEPPEPPPEPPQEHRQPEWLGPPDNILGAAVPLRLVLARNDNVALAITGATAYPKGLEINVALRVRTLPQEARLRLMRGSPFHPIRMGIEPPVEGIPPDLLRFGIQFSDGRKATTLDTGHWGRDAAPDGPVLIQRGGGGGDRAWDQRFWIWPLPPPGPLAFVVEWPFGDIALTRVETDAAPILEAAAQAQPLWPDGNVVSGGSWSTQVMMTRRDEKPGEADD